MIGATRTIATSTPRTFGADDDVETVPVNVRQDSMLPRRTRHCLAVSLVGQEGSAMLARGTGVLATVLVVSVLVVVTPVPFSSPSPAASSPFW
jgi:hypothetical protein